MSPNGEAPRVSILMPVYNGACYLREGINSILGQTYTDFEFIIIDDGSTDGTASILDNYKEPRVRVVRNEENLGLARSLNKGLELARGEYLARMDADDVSLPGRLARQAAFLDQHPDIGVLGCAVRTIDARGSPIRTIPRPTTHALILWGLCFGTSIAHPTVMFRKAIVERAGGYNEALLANQDRDLWLRLSAVTRFANLPETFLLYREHPAKISCRYSEVQVRNSAKAGQRMISGFLGYEVPLEVCYSFRVGRFETLNDVLQAIHLMRSLYDAFMAKQCLSTEEKRAISRDVAQRLKSVPWRWIHKAGVRREFLALAYRLDPLCVIKIFGSKVLSKMLLWNKT